MRWREGRLRKCQLECYEMRGKKFVPAATKKKKKKKKKKNEQESKQDKDKWRKKLSKQQ